MTDFKQWLKSISPELKETLEKIPEIIKVEGLDFIHDNFDNQGFETTPGNYDKWQQRKPPQVYKKGVSGKKSSRLVYTKAGRKYAKDINKNRAILVQRGSLRRSWDRKTTQKKWRIEFTSDKVYAEPHNEGSKVHPQRQMIGDSAALDARVEAKITRMMDELFK